MQGDLYTGTLACLSLPHSLLHRLVFIPSSSRLIVHIYYVECCSSYLRDIVPLTLGENSYDACGVVVKIIRVVTSKWMTHTKFLAAFYIIALAFLWSSACIHILTFPCHVLFVGACPIVEKFLWCKSFIWPKTPQNKFKYVLINPLGPTAEISVRVNWR